MARAKLAEVAYRGLNGVFPVFKPIDMTALQVRNAIEKNLIAELNSLEQRPQQTLVKIVRDESKADPNALTVTDVPCLADHPLVSGPRFPKLGIQSLSSLDRMSSGVMVMCIQDGIRKRGMLTAAQFPSTYEIKGRLGMATDTFDESGKVWEKTTYHHVTREKIDRVVAAMTRVHQSAMSRFSGIDMQTQEAYDLAVQGALRPASDTIPPIIMSMKCTQLNKPNFNIEIQCLKEDATFLRKTIHEIGLEMKSTAVTTQIRRTNFGPFTLGHALLKKHWKLDYIIEAIQQCKPLIQKKKVLPYYKMKKHLSKEVFQELKEQEAKLEVLKGRTQLLDSGAMTD